MKFLINRNVAIWTSMLFLVFSYLSARANLRIMSYNIENFWLRFDGQPETVTEEGARLDQDDFEKLKIVAAIINEKKPDVIGILECASLTELFFFNERFLEGEYRCWSFRAYDSRITGIPLGLMVRKNLQVKSVNLAEPKSFSSRGVIIADVSKSDYEFTLILVHLKSKIESKLGESVLKRDKQGNRLREIIKKKLKINPNTNIIICGDFNDSLGRDEQEITANVEDLIGKMVEPIVLEDGTEIEIYNPTLNHRDLDITGKLWTEKTKKYGAIQFDYFFLTEGANDEFFSLNHIYPEEYPNILEASDHIPIVLDLRDE